MPTTPNIRNTSLFIMLLVEALVVRPAAAQSPAADDRSPRNQVYQFMAKGPGSITGYLWIPEDCRKLRGLLVLAQNVPEGLIAGHPAIRKACADNNLGIMYSAPGFWPGQLAELGNPGVKHPEGTQRLVALLAELAVTSGYPEVATVPWLPIGESMSTLMVKGIINEVPERCIAGIFVCDIRYGTDRTVPILGTQGTACEWTQTTSDLRRRWQSPGLYQQVCDLRKATPSWPVTMMVEAGGGHFNCSEQMLQYIAKYIDCVATARLAADGSPALKPVDTNSGFLAHLPIPGKRQPPVEPARGASDLARPWFFDRSSAQQSQQIADVNWNASTQIPAVLAGDHCTVKPWTKNSVTEVEVTTAADFSLQPFLLDEIPAGFVAAGQALAKSSHTPVVQWVSGQIAPLGGNRFRVELDRTYKRRGSACLAVIVEGNGDIRHSVQPLLVNLTDNVKGTPQTINFKQIPDVDAGVGSVPLAAIASSGLPVSFYVEAGPAIIDNNRLVFTRIPPNARLPIAVTIVAWQWGTCEPPLFNKEIVSQTFNIRARRQ